MNQTSQTGYAPVNGLKIYYEFHGAANPARPPLVLLHGGGDTIGTSFGHVLPALAHWLTPNRRTCRRSCMIRHEHQQSVN
jgi:pimeloyl-ACP methyl ester carboxylesterase